MNIIRCIWLFFLSIQICAAQDPPLTTQQQLENTIEALEDENAKDDNYLQILQYHLRNPININTATAVDLQPLRLLTDLQIANIISYRNRLGPFISVYELQAVPTLDLATIRRIEAFIRLGEANMQPGVLSERLRGGEHQLLARMARVMQRSRGYDRSQGTHYVGDPNRLLLRYRYQYKNNLYYGLLGDKDAGEAFFRGAQKQGFDFYSAHIFLRDAGPIKALALGDHLVNLGQGLIQWQSLAFGKSADILSVKRQSPALMPYRAAGEFYFNRGAAMTMGSRKFDFTLFTSVRKLSGNYVLDSIERVTSFQTSGYYRTKNEIADRYNVGYSSFGASAVFHKNGLKLGLNTVHHRFSLPLQKKPEPYNYFALTGRQLSNYSLDYAFTHKNIHVFGEAAMDAKGNLATVAGILASADARLDISAFYRNIAPAYQAFTGNAFTESTSPTNESGFFVGLQFRPVQGWSINAYADFFKFPFLRYRQHSPAQGTDYLVQLSHTPARRIEIYMRYRHRNKPVNETFAGAAMPFPFNQARRNLRLHMSFPIMEHFSVRARAEVLWFRHQDVAEQGYLTYMEAHYKGHEKFGAGIRLQYFETEGYDSRIYAYESDVLYSFSIPAFFHKGFRYYVNVKFDLSQRITAWLRWADTYSVGRQNTGSGLDEIAGPHKSDFKIQFAYGF